MSQSPSDDDLVKLARTFFEAIRLIFVIPIILFLKMIESLSGSSPPPDATPGRNPTLYRRTGYSSSSEEDQDDVGDWDASTDYDEEDYVDPDDDPNEGWDDDEVDRYDDHDDDYDDGDDYGVDDYDDDW